MIDPIEKLIQASIKAKTPSVTPEQIAARKTASGEPSAQDSVDYNTDGLLEMFKSQVESLKTDLPGMIATGILNPTAQEAQQENPLNALIFRLTDPLQNILQHVPSNALNREQLNAFAEEISRFSKDLLAFKDNSLIRPLMQEAASADSVNNLLFTLSSHLDGVATDLRNRAV